MMNSVSLGFHNNCVLVILIVSSFIMVGGCSKASSSLVIESEDIDTLVLDSDKPIALSDTLALWPYGKRKAVSFTWDDGALRQTTAIARLFNRYSLKTTFYIVTNRIYDEDISYILEYLFALVSGHEVSSHTVDHLALTNLGVEEVEYQLYKSSDDIFRAFGYYPTTFAHPYRKMNKEIDSLIPRYYLSSRFSSLNSFLGRKVHSVIKADTYDSLKSEFDSFINQKNYDWILYSGHGFSSPDLDLIPVYQPLDSIAFASFLSYVVDTYDNDVFISTYEDIIMSQVLRDEVVLRFGEGFIYLDTSNIIDVINKFKHPRLLVSLVFHSNRMSFYSNALVDIRVVGNDSIVTLDLRKGSLLFYE